MYDVDRIKRAMAEQFLSPRKLAAKAKLTPITVYRFFETGQSHPATVGKIVRALKLDPKDIVLNNAVVAVVRTTTAADIPSPLTAKAEQELVVSAKENR